MAESLLSSRGLSVRLSVTDRTMSNCFGLLQYPLVIGSHLHDLLNTLSVALKFIQRLFF